MVLREGHEERTGRRTNPVRSGPVEDPTEVSYRGNEKTSSWKTAQIYSPFKPC